MADRKLDRQTYKYTRVLQKMHIKINKLINYQQIRQMSDLKFSIELKNWYASGGGRSTSSDVCCSVPLNSKETRGQRHSAKAAPNDPAHTARGVHCTRCRRFKPRDRQTQRHRKHR